MSDKGRETVEDIRARHDDSVADARLLDKESLFFLLSFLLGVIA